MRNHVTPLHAESRYAAALTSPWFPSTQPLRTLWKGLPEYFVPPATLARLAAAPARLADAKTRSAFLKTYDLFRDIKSRCAAEEVLLDPKGGSFVDKDGAPVAELEMAAAAVPESELRSGLSFEEFFGVMLEDELRLEAEGEEHLAHHIFVMIDSVQLPDDDEDDEKERAEDKTVGGRKEEMISREEFKTCFSSVPNFAPQSVDEFVYLFPLNSDGQIELEGFATVVRELDVLLHAG